MNKKIATLIAGILIVGLVSAGLLTHFAIITGTVEVKNAILYLSCEESGISDKPYLLTINNDNTGSCTRSFTDGYTNQWFVTEPLGIESFYGAEYEVTLKIKNTHENETGQVLVQLWIVDEDNNLKYPDPIDSDFFEIAPDSTWEDSLTLIGDELNLDEGDRLALKLSDGFHDITYQIQINEGNNKIEIIPTT